MPPFCSFVLNTRDITTKKRDKVLPCSHAAPLMLFPLIIPFNSHNSHAVIIIRPTSQVREPSLHQVKKLAHSYYMTELGHIPRSEKIKRPHSYNLFHSISQ